MSKDNKTKKIEQEYATHIVPKEISDRILDSTYLEINIEDILHELAKNSRKTYMEYLKNRVIYKIIKLTNRITRNNDGFDRILEEDCDYILELLIHIGDNSELFAEIKDAITEENYQELIKLVDFTVKKYDENSKHILGKRKTLITSLKGFSITNNSSDSREETKEFVRRKINECIDNKHLEKKQ